MLRGVIIFQLFLVSLLASLALAQEQSAGILEGVRSKYRQLSGLEVSYTREVITRSMSMMGDQVEGDLASGRIYFRPPDSLKLKQESPREEVIVTNGQILWWYIPAEKRVYRYPRSQFGEELTVLSDIFRGLSKVNEDFRVEIQPDGPDCDSLVKLTPDPPWREIQKIILGLSKHHDIQMVEIHNQVGGKTRFILGKTRKRSDFEEGLFKFTVPPGVRVIKEQPQ